MTPFPPPIHTLKKVYLIKRIIFTNLRYPLLAWECAHILSSPLPSNPFNAVLEALRAWRVLPAGDLNGEKKWKFTPCPRETLAGAKIRLISKRKTVWFVCERRFGGEWTSEGTRQRDAGDGGTMKRKRREERRGEKWFVRAEKTETFSKKVLPLFRGNGCCGSLFTLSRVDSKYLYEARTFTPLCSSYVIERNAVSPPTGCLFFFLSFSESFSSTFLHRRTFHRSFLLLYLLPWNVTRERMERVISIANFHLWEPIIRSKKNWKY